MVFLNRYQNTNFTDLWEWKKKPQNTVIGHGSNGRLHQGFCWGVDVRIPFQWQGQFAFPMTDHWKLGFYYGRYSNRLNQRFLGVNIQCGWSPNFANDRPVESLDYEID